MSLNTPGRVPRRLARGTNTEVMDYMGPQGELVVNTDTGRVHVQNGTDPGGIALRRLDEGTVADKEVTNAKLADMPANRLKGSDATGRPEDLTAAEAVSILKPELDTQYAQATLGSADDGKIVYYDHADRKIKSAWAAPKSPIADLRDFMDLRFGAGAWTYRTGVNTGSDAGLAINDALQALRTRYTRGKLIIPPSGQWLVKTALDPLYLGGHQIEGMGSQASQLVYAPLGAGAMFAYDGSATGGGLRGLGVLLESGLGNSNATFLLQRGDAVKQPDQMEFDDIYVTAFAGSYWYDGWLVDGQARTSPQGVRTCHATNIQLFCCHHMGAGFYNAQKFSVINLGIYAGTGTGNALYISGNAASFSTVTQDCTFSNVTVSGDLNLTASRNVTVQGKVGTITGGATFDEYDIFVKSGAALAGTLGSKGRIQVIV